MPSLYPSSLLPKLDSLQIWQRGIFWFLATLGIAFALRMSEWPSWQNPEYRLGREWLLATHDAYHWVAGAEGFGLANGHPMAIMLWGMAKMLNSSPAAVAFWFPAILSSLTSCIVFAWVWALGSMEAGLAAGLLTILAPGFLGRTLLGFYDTDLITLFFPMLMSFIPACWAMRYMLLPQMILRRLTLNSGLKATQRLWGRSTPTGKSPLEHLGNPLRWEWIILISLSGLLSCWTQEWHSVFPYLTHYNVILLIFMSLIMAPHGRRGLLLLGSLAYSLPALTGLPGLVISFTALFAGLKQARKLRLFLSRPAILVLLVIGTAILLLQDDIVSNVFNHLNAYLKQSGDVKNTGDQISLVYPSVAQSIIEVQDLDLAAVLAYCHPWGWASILGFLGFCIVLYRRPGAFFLLPLAALGILSIKLGGRMVMFGAPIVAIGLTLPFYWVLQYFFHRSPRGADIGLLTSSILLILLVLPFTDMVQAMSQGPIINRRHAEALTRAKSITPPDSLLWLWWDWGYAAHHFARRTTIADGAQHGGPSLYFPAAVFATDNARFARQIICYTSQVDNEPGNVFKGLNSIEAQNLMEKLRSPETQLIEQKGRQFIIVSFEMLRLGFWISNFGNWNFITRQGEGGALSIIPQSLAYKLDSGVVRLNNDTSPVSAASINIFEETGLIRRNYVQEWFETHPEASQNEQKNFLAGRRNIHFFFNRITGEKLVMDEFLYNSLMVQLLTGNPQDARFSPYFRLVFDNVFTRIYEVL